MVVQKHRQSRLSNAGGAGNDQYTMMFGRPILNHRNGPFTADKIFGKQFYFASEIQRIQITHHGSNPIRIVDIIFVRCCQTVQNPRKTGILII